MDRIEIKNLSHQFGDKQVLNNIQAKFTLGGIVAIKGINGSGKTTFLRILSTLLSPTQGEVHFQGRDLTKSPMAFRPLIGWMPSSDRSWFMHLTGWENLRFIASLVEEEGSTLNQKVDDWGDFPLFREALNTPLYKASTGMRHLLSIFRTQLGKPRLVVLDEPFRSLDPDLSVEVLQRLKKSSSDKLTLMSLHHEDSRFYFDSKYRLTNGELVSSS